MKPRKSAVTATGFSFQVLGDNNLNFPYNGQDALTLSISGAVPNSWYMVQFPTNAVQDFEQVGAPIVPTTTEISLLTDANGNRTFDFNAINPNTGVVDDDNHYQYLSPQNANHWDKLATGTYLFNIRPFKSALYTASVSVNITNTVNP